jgi:hypothetical protein
MLVAVPDPAGANFPAAAIGFNSPLTHRFNFPSIVLASTDDPFASDEYAARNAATWGSRFVSIGARGHINTSSGLADWPEGYALLESLRS